MRIDDLNRGLQSPEAAKTDAVGRDRVTSGGNRAPDPDSDAASISQLATNALDPALNASSAKAHEARLEALRLKVERGEYHVSADEIAASIIDQHIAD
jgi:anti-sigma28 factor (negative regulator of flagellin synthesis)